MWKGFHSLVLRYPTAFKFNNTLCLINLLQTLLEKLKSQYSNVEGLPPDRILSGNIVAPNNKLEWTGYHIDAWLTFSYVNGLVITGNGLIDGQGSVWWSQPCLHDLPYGRTCKGPSALVFHSCNVPKTSPNTDGINVSASNNVTVKNSYIGTGDDCIAVSGGSSFVNITGISCRPGHGISIGALGKGGHDEVEEIHVRNCTLT
ncbi:hypothetical protein POM88_006782 [Heracleum sosnowskyi]|uniref:Polygalacturonase n=1 Tax=Heracleum sosnowskyi TaxID=360622 RepID=A0AAD8N526_9APIA|nr:hypothetical protein POM88_006782 [Heracleum sosnowskyi]